MFTQCSLGFKFDSVAEHAWFEKQLNKEFIQTELDKRHSGVADDEGMEYCPLADYFSTGDEDTANLGFRYFIDVVEDNGSGRISFFHDEEADVVQISEILHAYLATFHPDKHIVFTWCSWCDKPQVNEFFGGTILVTSNNVYSCGPDLQRQDLLRQAHLKEFNWK
jgi:hypothetical protein